MAGVGSAGVGSAGVGIGEGDAGNAPGSPLPPVMGFVGSADIGRGALVGKGSADDGADVGSEDREGKGDAGSP